MSLLRSRLVLLALWLLIPAAARAADESIDVYLQPLPAEAGRLTLAIASVSVTSAAGPEYALDVKSAAVGQPNRQRLLASGRVPAGSYTGFTVRINRAALKSDRGDVALPLPESPIAVKYPFTVSNRRASLFWLQFRNEGASADAFNPMFAGALPPKAMVARAGFVTNSGSNTITVFDKSLGQAVGAIDTCSAPTGLALDQRARRLYVVCARDDEIQVIDVTAGDLLERSRLSPGDGPREAALTPDGRTLVSVNTDSNSISFFDTSPLTRMERVAVGNGPASVMIDPTGARAFVFNALSTFVSVVDIGRRAVVATIPTDASPLRGTFNARGDRLFVIHDRSPYMTVIDPLRLTVINRTRVSSGLICIKADNRRDLLYVGGPGDRMIEFYNPTALLPVGAMKTPAGPSYLTIDAEEDRLYIVSPDTRTLVIGSLADRNIVSEIDVGEGPRWVAVMGEK